MRSLLDLRTHSLSQTLFPVRLLFHLCTLDIYLPSTCGFYIYFKFYHHSECQSTTAYCFTDTCHSLAMDPNPAGPVQLVTREDRKRANDQRRNQKRKQKKHEDPDASEVRRFGGMLSPTKRKQPPKSDQPPKKKRPTKSEPNTAACEPLASTSSNEPVMETLTHLDTPTQFIDEFQLYEHLYMSSKTFTSHTNQNIGFNMDFPSINYRWTGTEGFYQ